MNPRLHYPLSGGVKRGKKEGLQGGKKQDIVKVAQLGNALKRFVIAMSHGKNQGLLSVPLDPKFAG